MEKIEAYKVSDGTIFEDSEDARRYQQLKRLLVAETYKNIEELAMFLNENRESVMSILRDQGE